MEFNIVLAPDNNYVKHAAAVMASVLTFNSKYIHFWILDEGLSDEHKRKLSIFDGYSNYKVSFAKINKEEFREFPESGYITRAMWYRLKIGTLLPASVTVCLYLDCDTIVNSDLTELFSTKFGSKCVAAGIDCLYEKFNKNYSRFFHKGHPYFNSGVLLINLEQWRRQKIEDKIMTFLKDGPERMKMLDKTILNIILNVNVLDFGIRNNFQFTPKYLGETSYFKRKEEYRNAKNSPQIIHFVGEFKPWKLGYNAINPYYKLYLSALAKTQWKMTEAEINSFVEKSEKLKKSVFLSLLFKQLKRKPWWIFRKYFWNRIFL